MIDRLLNKYFSGQRPENNRRKSETFASVLRFFYEDIHSSSGAMSGQPLYNDGKKDASGKNPVFVVNDSDFDSNNPTSKAVPLKYSINGKNNEGVTGKSYRDNHPLKNKGSRAGDQVYYEDLLNMTTEFNNLIASAFKDFTFLQKRGGFYKDWGFYFLVAPNKKYDLKSLIETDGTPSYAAIKIGQWSLYDGKLTRYDDYGNLLYGYMGHYAGFTLENLKRSSNNQQYTQDFTHGDEARDTNKIIEGFGWYSQPKN